MAPALCRGFHIGDYNMKITYIEKGKEFDFKRIDRIKTIILSKTFESRGLLYGYKNQFEIVCIAKEDIIEITK
jgi:hypothetical protein